MSKSIQDFFGGKRGKSRVEKFEGLSEGKTKEEKRQLEVEVLKPDKIPPHVHEKTEYSKFSPIASHSVRIVFPDDESLELFKKHFNVSRHVEASLTSMDKFMEIIRLLDDGIIVYDNKLKKASVVKK